MGQYGYGELIMLFIVSLKFFTVILNPGILTLKLCLLKMVPVLTESNLHLIFIIFATYQNQRERHRYCCSKIKRRVGFTLSQATKALRERRGIALLYFRPLH